MTTITMFLSKLTIPPMRLLLIVSLISILSWRDILWPIMTRMNVAKLIKPRPPTSIRIKIITWPKILQCSAVETTVSPVTVTAEVEVKNAFANGVPPSAALAIGNDKRIPPSKINEINPYKSIKGEEKNAVGFRRDGILTTKGFVSRSLGLRIIESLNRLSGSFFCNRYPSQVNPYKESLTGQYWIRPALE